MSQKYQRPRPPEAPPDAPLKDRIVNYIERTDYVSFAELRNRFGGDGRLDGDFCISLPDRPNSVLWSGMSEEFCDVMRALIREHAVDLAGSCSLTYMIDGGMPSMPVAKRIGKQDFKSPRWVPITFRPKGAT